MVFLCKKECYSFSEVAEYFRINFDSLFCHILFSDLNVAVYIDVDKYLNTPLLVCEQDPYFYPTGLYYIDKYNLVELYYGTLDSLKIDYIFDTSANSYNDIASSSFGFHENLAYSYGCSYELNDLDNDNINCENYIYDENYIDHRNWIDEFTIDKKNLRILYKDLIIFERDIYPKIDIIDFSNKNVFNNQIADKFQNKISTNLSPNKKLGGRPQGPLAEAIEKVYVKLLDDGCYDDLSEYKIKCFLTRLQAMADKKLNKNAFNDIPDLIKEVKISAGICYVATEDQYIKHSKGRETIIPGRKYSINEISKLLCKFRRKYPLPK